MQNFEVFFKKKLPRVQLKMSNLSPRPAAFLAMRPLPLPSFPSPLFESKPTPPPFPFFAPNKIRKPFSLQRSNRYEGPKEKGGGRKGGKRDEVIYFSVSRKILH